MAGSRGYNYWVRAISWVGYKSGQVMVVGLSGLDEQIGLRVLGLWNG